MNELTNIATALGFDYARKGCPCNGTPLIYTRKIDWTQYTLTLWQRRNAWRLTAKGCVLATGNADNMTEKISKIINQ